ncbi:MAG: hypothetical protein JNL36_00720 [Candidatus Kapabacteria bacterium]|nr:hypothetical protein [Candidatus Kapabacteria bacterium]
MEELQNLKIQNELLQLPEEIQQQLLLLCDAKSFCEKIIQLLNIGDNIKPHDKIPLVNLLICFSTHNSFSIEQKATYLYKSALFSQNLIDLEKAEELFLQSKELFTVIDDVTSVQNLNVHLAINCIYLSKFAEAQQFLHLVEEDINLSPQKTDLESIRLLCKYFKAVNYVHLGTASRKAFIQYTEKIYNFFHEYTCDKTWNYDLLAVYYLLLQSTVDGFILIGKYWLAYTIWCELPYVIVHPNTISQTKEFAQNDLVISEFDLNLRVGNVQKNKENQIIALFDTLDETYFEFFNQKLNISILLCEYYFTINNYSAGKKWFKRFEKQKIKSKKYFVPEETGYIDFYNSAIQFFSKHGDTSLAQTYMEINTKLHKEAIEKADNFRYEEMKLWKYLQKEKEQAMQLELQIETIKQQLLTQIDSSLTLQQLLQEFSKTIHSSLVDFPEKKQHQLLKQVKKFNDVQQETNDVNKFEHDFSTIYPLFSSNFIQKHPSITKTDMYVCMAVLLNLTNQQIANFFHIEVKTIEEYIRRIRRKLQLEQRANLKAYLLLFTK